MENFVKYCKDYIVNHIEEYIGNVCDGCDLGYDITSAPNMDGTLTFSRYKALEYLSAWHEYAGEYFDYEKQNFGSDGMHNPFGNPEAYMVCMVVEGVNNILGRCPSIEEKWNDNFELTEDMVETIVSEVEDINEITF